MLVLDRSDSEASEQPRAPRPGSGEVSTELIEPSDEPEAPPVEDAPATTSDIQSALTENFTGLGGSGYTGRYNGHSLTFTVTSEDPIGTWGYIVPTSTDHSYGLDETTRTSTSVTTTVYGPPAYARVFVQAGYEGTAITCTITVDGRVTDQRTARGRYVQAMCQG